MKKKITYTLKGNTDNDTSKILSLIEAFPSVNEMQKMIEKKNF